MLNGVGFSPPLKEWYHYKQKKREPHLPRNNKVHPDQMPSWRGDTFPSLLAHHPDTRFVLLRRRDLIACAVSRYLAMRSETWWVHSDQHVRKLRAIQSIPISDKDLLDNYRLTIEHDQYWQRELESRDVSSVQVFYEDLVDHTEFQLERVFKFIGIFADISLCIKSASNRKQSIHRPETQACTKRLKELLAGLRPRKLSIQTNSSSINLFTAEIPARPNSGKTLHNPQEVAEENSHAGKSNPHSAPDTNTRTLSGEHLNALKVNPNLYGLDLPDHNLGICTIPKNGGTSLWHIIYMLRFGIKCASTDDVYRFDQILAGPISSRIHRLVVVRDPIDRFMSAFCFLKSKKSLKHEEDLDLHGFIDRFDEFYRRPDVLHHMQPQFLTAHQTPIDHFTNIIPFTDYSRIFKIIESIVNQPVARPHCQATNGPRPAINQKHERFLRDFYAIDYENGYCDPAAYPTISQTSVPEIQNEPKSQKPANIRPRQGGNDARKLAFLFLLQQDLNHPIFWEQFIEQAGRNANVYAHSKQFPLPAYTSRLIRNNQISEQYETQWGDVSLVRAMLALLKAALANPDNKAFAFVSESCVPIQPFDTIYRQLVDGGKSWIKATRNNTRRARQVDRQAIPPKHFFHSSQWISLSRTDAQAIVQHGNVDAFENVFAADEHFFASTLSLLGRDFNRDVHPCLMTRAAWNKAHRSSPKAFRRVWRPHIDGLVNSGCLFARKYSPASNIAQYQRRLVGSPEANGYPQPEFVEIEGMRVDLSYPSFSERMRRVLRNGTYEQNEIRHLKQFVKTGDRVLDLGAGTGLTAAIVARSGKTDQVVCVEANNELIPVLQRTFSLNNLDVEIIHGVAHSTGSSMPIQFHVGKDFWGNSLHQKPEHYEAREVPSINIDELISRLRPTLVLCDIEGAEAPLLEQIDLSVVDRMVVEFHPGIIGKHRVHRVLKHLSRKGFSPIPSFSTPTVVYLAREQPRSVL